MSIGIIDIGIGNIGSLKGALFSQGWNTSLVTQASELDGFSHLIIPGVGSFSEGMRRLHNAGLVEAICNHASCGKPLLGICLGMQLLASIGNEGGTTEGLGLISGDVRFLEVGAGYRLPHVGWNTLHATQKHPLLKGIRADVDFYFVHSYSFHEEDNDDVAGTTKHGVKFASFIASKNIAGVQFHPEKSQRNGLRLLDNFCLWDGVC